MTKPVGCADIVEIEDGLEACALRDAADVHHAPKRSLEEMTVKL